VACGIATIANLTTILVTVQLAPRGAAVVAAYGIAARLEFLIIPLAFSVGSALTAPVGRAVGAGNWAEARRIAWTGGALSFAGASSVGLLVAIFPTHFARAFTTDAEVVAIAVQALSIIGPAYGGFGLGMALYFASLGAGRLRWPVAAACCRLVFAVGGGWLLAQPLGLAGHFVGVALGITAYGVVLAISVRRGVWR